MEEGIGDLLAYSLMDEESFDQDKEIEDTSKLLNANPHLSCRLQEVEKIELSSSKKGEASKVELKHLPSMLRLKETLIFDLIIQVPD